MAAEAIIRELGSTEILFNASRLAELLIDCVHHGASVSFMAPLPPEKAKAFWHKVAEHAASKEKVVVIAEMDGKIIGTVQVVFQPKENQPFSAEISKLLVHSQARRHGLGRKLLEAAEAIAKQHKKRLLMLDVAQNSAAENLYRSAGWIEVGVVPRHAYNPDGSYCDTVFMYKEIGN